MEDQEKTTAAVQLPASPSPAQDAFDNGDYYEAKRLLQIEAATADPFLVKALAFDRVLIVVPIVLFGIWLSAALVFSTIH